MAIFPRSTGQGGFGTPPFFGMGQDQQFPGNQTVFNPGENAPFSPQTGGMFGAAPQQKRNRGVGGFLQDFLINYGAAQGNPLAQSVISQRQALERQRQAAEFEAQQKSATRYDPQKLGDSIVRLNPQTGQYETLVTAPQNRPAAAQIAVELGLQPGTPEYQSFIRSREDLGVATSVDPATGQTVLTPYSRAQLSGQLGGGQAASGQAPMSVRTQQDYDRLPPGTEYIAPDGSRRTKGGQTPSASGGFRP